MMTNEPTRDDVVLLAKNAGLDLPPAYLDQLADAYGRVREMVARLPGSRPRGDEPAHVFRAATYLPTKG